MRMDFGRVTEFHPEKSVKFTWRVSSAWVELLVVVLCGIFGAQVAGWYLLQAVV